MNQRLIARLAPANRRFFAPEVVQTSAMDCGPAALKSLLEGFGIPISYGRLREACQTDVDGTSIDTLEEVAAQLGLDAEQTMLPVDHLLLPETDSLPAIVTVRLASGLGHFVVLWGRVGPFVQVMDPATGRRWPTLQRFLDEVYIHTHPVPAEVWREWAGAEGFCAPLRARIARLSGEKLPTAEQEHLIDTARQDEGWYTLACLDAAARMVESLIQAGGLRRGAAAVQILADLFESARQEKPGEHHTIPPLYWSVLPPSPAADAAEGLDDDMLLLRGALLVQVAGLREPGEPAAAAAAGEAMGEAADEPQRLSPELVAALREPPARPGLEILRMLREDGLLTPIMLTFALLLAAGSVIVQAVLLRGILDLGQSLSLVGQRIEIMGAVFAFVLAFFLLDFPIQAAILRIGRNLETRLRIRFLEKIPRLSDRYFQSRLTSDMTQRMHGLRQIRTLPHLGLDFLRLSFQMLFTAIGIIWLHPLSAPLTILAAVFAVATALLSQPLLIERDLRLRTHLGALSRFYLDTLLGLIPIRTHGAEKAVRREHESLMVEWLRASDEFYRVEVTAGAVDALVGLFFSVLLLSHYIISGGTTSGVLLFFYWALSLPALGRGLVSLAEQYPMQRNQVLRLLEPLNAPEESTLDGDEPEPAPPAPASTPAAGSGAAIRLENVTVRAGGHTILSDLNVQIAPEEHVAIVGPSGAGKSSLVGILLGWHRPAAGRAELDGLRLRGTRLHALRRQTVWVDPAVQLWNRSLLDNLRYGNTEGQEPPGSLPIEQADLLHLLKKLPDGLQTPLGEGGGLVSGGEGQRVRLGRAMLREGARLVILDEPFRGLDRAQRRELLARARHYWRAATLLFISHDIDESLAFERVLVIEDGQIIEDGAPATLAAQPDTRYSALLRADEAVRREMWADEVWRRLWMENGQFGPPPAGEPEQP